MMRETVADGTPENVKLAVRKQSPHAEKLAAMVWSPQSGSSMDLETVALASLMRGTYFVTADVVVLEKLAPWRP